MLTWSCWTSGTNVVPLLCDTLRLRGYRFPPRGIWRFLDTWKHRRSLKHWESGTVYGDRIPRKPHRTNVSGIVEQFHWLWKVLTSKEGCWILFLWYSSESFLLDVVIPIFYLIKFRDNIWFKNFWKEIYLNYNIYTFSMKVWGDNQNSIFNMFM